MAVLTEALVHLVGGWKAGRCESGDWNWTPMEHRGLADAMRRLPGRYADRLHPRTLERITGAVAAGRWERAVDQLITALCCGAETVTPEERDELRAVLDAMNMSGERVDPLLLQR